MPAGYRTYVSNNEERLWRSLKAHLGPNAATQDASNLVVKICDLLAGWVGHIAYKNLLLRDVPPLDERYRTDARRSGERMDAQPRSKELLVSHILNYVTAHGAEHTFLEEDVEMYIEVNHAVKLCTKVYLVDLMVCFYSKILKLCKLFESRARH